MTLVVTDSETVSHVLVSGIFWHLTKLFLSIFFPPAPAGNYKPSCCTIGMLQSNLVRQMEGDVSNEEPILAPAAACLYRRRSFAQTLH